MHLESLSDSTKKTLELLANSGVAKDFYLAGGTGLALYLGHRYSYDLDFFSAKNFDESQLVQRLSSFNALRTAEFRLENQSEQTINGVLDGVKISFLGYRYPLLKPCQMVGGILLADVLDIACMKIDTISKRGAKRDFVDIYFILKEVTPLPDFLKSFVQKYASVNYNMVHIKKSLVYFEDAEADAIPNMIKPVNWEGLKDFLREEVVKIG